MKGRLRLDPGGLAWIAKRSQKKRCVGYKHVKCSLKGNLEAVEGGHPSN